MPKNIDRLLRTKAPIHTIKFSKNLYREKFQDLTHIRFVPSGVFQPVTDSYRLIHKAHAQASNQLASLNKQA